MNLEKFMARFEGVDFPDNYRRLSIAGHIIKEWGTAARVFTQDDRSCPFNFAQATVMAVRHIEQYAFPFDVKSMKEIASVADALTKDNKEDLLRANPDYLDKLQQFVRSFRSLSKKNKLSMPNCSGRQSMKWSFDRRREARPKQ